jgi:hypothetical protein
VYESGVFRTQMGNHDRSEKVAVLGTPCTVPPRNSNVNAYTFLYDKNSSQPNNSFSGGRCITLEHETLCSVN